MAKARMNFELLKNLFPIFKQQVNGHELAFLDSVSTAQMPESVLQAIMNYYGTYKSNIGRGVYTFAERATQDFQDSRKKIATFLNANPAEIIVTSGATDGINKVVQSWAEYNIQPGDEIIVSEVEHHSNFVPWQQLALQKKAVLKIVPVNDQGVIEVATLQKYLSTKTKLVAMIHTSNLLGTTNDVKAIVQAVHEVGAKVLVDASQSVVHQKIDVKNLNCDFLVFSGHKLFGPTGIGILFIKQELFTQCQVRAFGGGMVFSVADDVTELRSNPHCFEAGTQPIAQMIGLGAAVDFINEHIDFDQLQQHETRLVRLLIDKLQPFKTIKVISHAPRADQHSNLVTFVCSKYHAHDIAAFLDQYGIAVRAGHHCVQPFHQRQGINASLRVSFSLYNNEQDVVTFIEALCQLYKVS